MTNSSSQPDVAPVAASGRHRTPRIMWLCVCVAGMAITVAVGYGLTSESVFAVTGIIGGLLGGVAWMLMMGRYHQRQPNRNLIGLGILGGILAGLLATFILWSPIIYQVIRHILSNPCDLVLAFPLYLLMGLIAAACAIVGGAFAGGLCGCLWEGLLIRAVCRNRERSG